MHDESTRDKILQTAGPIFARMGFQGATVRDISDAAEVNLASINYYFGDKKKLYVEAVKLARDQQAGQMTFTNLREGIPPQILLEKFVMVLLRKLGVGQEPDWQMQLLVREFLSPGDACREIVDDYFRPYFEVLLQIMDRLAGRPLPTAVRLQLGFSLIGQCLHYRLAGPITEMFVDRELWNANFDTESLAHHIATFTMGGIQSVVNRPATPSDVPGQ